MLANQATASESFDVRGGFVKAPFNRTIDVPRLVEDVVVLLAKLHRISRGRVRVGSLLVDGEQLRGDRVVVSREDDEDHDDRRGHHLSTKSHISLTVSILAN